MFIYYHLYHILLKVSRELLPTANNRPVSLPARDSNENTVAD